MIRFLVGFGRGFFSFWQDFVTDLEAEEIGGLFGAVCMFLLAAAIFIATFMGILLLVKDLS